MPLLFIILHKWILGHVKSVCFVFFFLSNIPIDHFTWFVFYKFPIFDNGAKKNLWEKADHIEIEDLLNIVRSEKLKMMKNNKKD